MARYLIAVSHGFNSPSYLRRKLDELIAESADTTLIAVDTFDGPLRKALIDSRCKITWLSPTEATRRRLRSALTEVDKTIIFWDGQSHADLVFDAHLLGVSIQILPVEVTKVVNRDRGDPYDFYIGRRSPWGNPYPVGTGEGRYSREEAIALFQKYFGTHILADHALRRGVLRLRGCRIACHCKPLACHGDVIAGFLNSLDPDALPEITQELPPKERPAASINAIEVKPDVAVDAAQRDVVFISHANPEDNQFSKWLALQLTREGYKVWTDLTDLLGGEDFWKDIEKVLRNRTAKFLYVLSATSNEKEGPLNELAVARQVARTYKLDNFIVPLLVGSLNTDLINIELKRLNAVIFRDRWFAGLAHLLETLSEQRVPKVTTGAATLSSWWKRQYSSNELLTRKSEKYHSNHFPVLLPPSIFLHRIFPAPANLQISGEVPPWRQHGSYICSFAAASDFRGHLPLDVRIAESRQVSLDEFLSGNISIASQTAHDDAGVPRQQAQNLVIDLTQQAAFAGFCKQGLVPRQLSSKTFAFYFPSGLVPEDTLRSKSLNTRRQIVGFRSVGLPDAARKIYWHFAVSGRLTFAPNARWTFGSHVLFSDDGLALWPDVSRLHRARRRYCRNWWNDKWRDLLLLTAAWLAGEKSQIHLTVGTASSVLISAEPLMFESPVSYEAPEEGLELDETFEDVDEVSDADDEASLPERA